MRKSIIKTIAAAVASVTAGAWVLWQILGMIGNVQTAQQVAGSLPDIARWLNTWTGPVALIALIVILFEEQVRNFFKPIKVKIIGMHDAGSPFIAVRIINRGPHECRVESVSMYAVYGSGNSRELQYRQRWPWEGAVDGKAYIIQPRSKLDIEFRSSFGSILMFNARDCATKVKSLRAEVKLEDETEITSGELKVSPLTLSDVERSISMERALITDLRLRELEELLLACISEQRREPIDLIGVVARHLGALNNNDEMLWISSKLDQAFGRHPFKCLESIVRTEQFYAFVKEARHTGHDLLRESEAIEFAKLQYTQGPEVKAQRKRIIEEIKDRYLELLPKNPKHPLLVLKQAGGGRLENTDELDELCSLLRKGHGCADPFAQFSFVASEERLSFLKAERDEELSSPVAAAAGRLRRSDQLTDIDGKPIILPPSIPDKGTSPNSPAS